MKFLKNFSGYESFVLFNIIFALLSIHIRDPLTFVWYVFNAFTLAKSFSLHNLKIPFYILVAFICPFGILVAVNTVSGGLISVTLGISCLYLFSS